MVGLIVSRIMHALVAAGAAFFWAAIAIDIVLVISTPPGTAINPASLPFIIANNPGAYALPLTAAIIIFLASVTKPAVGDAVLLNKYGRG
jgi:hypothetical protein